jgi:hypothetical protein
MTFAVVEKGKKMRLINVDKLINNINEFAECVKAGSEFTRGYIAAHKAFAKLLAEQPTIEQPKWISCAERLPELHTKVLCCGKKGGRFIAELNTWGHDNALYWTKRDGKGCPTVTHWMPLPTPPKEDE